MVWWSKLKSRLRLQGKEGRVRLVSKLNVEDEYKEAIRTNSYNEICTKVIYHIQTHSSSSSSSSIINYSNSNNIPPPPPHDVNLSQYLLQPHQQFLPDDIIKSSNLHSLILDYFDATLEACNVSELLLRCVHQTRLHYQMLLVGLHCQASDYDIAIINNLSSFSSLKNLLSTITPTRFAAMHDRHNLLLAKLTLKCKKVRKKAIFVNRCKKLLGCALIVSYGVLGIALMVLAIHSLVGSLAVPGFVACFLGFMKKREKLGSVLRSSRKLERICQQLDAAARGVYILINDFDTMSRLVRRLNDEIEHIKAIADICVRNGRGDEVLKEVVREIGIQENEFLEQLKELEQHIYLCFLTINRSRRQVLREITY